MSDIGLYSLDSEGNVTFSFKNIERVVSGPEEALQVVANHLFTTPGSNTYNRDEGGGLQQMLKDPIKSQEEINADAAIIVNKTQASVLNSQSRDKPANATITGLRLQSVALVRENLEIRLTIVINLLDGNSFQSTFRVT
jgi:hypothetical protein